ncbi:MAG: hypothetical protein L6Q84_32080 [Polyangiaceae bacterium]|nr:hypothetical protein [Polyangiaceae bacterium]
MSAIPPTVRAAFVMALRSLTSHAGALPDPLLTGRVLCPHDPASSASETLRVLAGHDDDGYFLDYFRRDQTSAWHGRLRPERPDEDLENYEGQFGMSVFPDPADTAREKQRVIAHNAKVREVLRHKGFED